VWRPVRAAGEGGAAGDLPALLWKRARTTHFSPGSSPSGRPPDRLQSTRPAAWRRLLWRWLPIALALTGRFARLRERLAYQASADADTSLIWAAVAVVLAPDPDSILLIRRAERTGDPWSGHMALPGGRRETGDRDLLTTAIRETREEVGIELRSEDLAGRLDDVVPRTPVLPPIAVRPFVFIPPTRPMLSLNPEVASARWIAVDHLLRPDTHHPVRLDAAGQSRQVMAYQLDDGIVWGMTERILISLILQLRD
jgi:8-oxo-dGTP pyrophosphatase MutT (NUDIX family)